MGGAAQIQEKQEMSVHFLPYAVEGNVFHLRLVPNECFPFARDLLNECDAESVDLVDFLPELAGVDAFALHLQYHCQNFFAELNYRIALDYLYVASKENNSQYLHQTLYYFTKAMLEGHSQAYIQLLVVLEDLAFATKSTGCREQLDAQLRFWLDQSLWLVGTIDERAAVSKKERKPGRRRNSSSAEKPHDLFSRTIMEGFKPAKSRRPHQLYSLDSDKANFSRRSACLISDNFSYYFSESAQQTNRDLMVMMEVLAGEMARLFGAQEQPRYYFARNAEGILSSYTEMLKAVTDNKDEFSETIEGMGRVWALKLLLSDNDPHNQNIICIPAAVKENRQVISVDTDRSLWPVMAFFHGVENDPQEIVQYLSNRPKTKKQYDANKAIFSVYYTDDNTWRSYYTAKTEDQLHSGPSANEIDHMPNLFETMPKVQMCFDEQYQQDPRFKHEFLVTQLRYHVSKSLEELLIYNILGDYQRECDLVILKRACERKERLEALKQSQVVVEFLKQYFTPIGFVLMYEIYCYIASNEQYFDDENFLPLNALNKTTEKYLALLDFLDIDYSYVYKNDLQQFCGGLYSDDIHQVESCLLRLNSVAKTYQNTLKMPSDALKVENVSQQLCARKGRLFVQKNKQNPVYIFTLEVLGQIEAQCRRLKDLRNFLGDKNFQLIKSTIQDLKTIEKHLSQPEAVDFSYYENDVHGHEVWSKNLKCAVDMLELTRVAHCYTQKNANSEKAIVIKNLIPLMHRVAASLITYRRDKVSIEPLKMHMEKIIQLYIFILGARRHEVFDSFRAGAAKLFGLQFSCSKSLREWQQTADSIAEDDGIIETINASTAMMEKGAQLSFSHGVEQQQITANNWGQFFRQGVCISSANQQEMFNERFLQSIQVSRTVSCAA